MTKSNIRKIAIAIVINIIALNIKSQSSIDSLASIVKTLTKYPMVKTLGSSAYETRNNNPQEAINLALEVAKISKEKNIIVGQLFSHRLLGNLYYKVQNYEEAISHFEQCIKIAKTIYDSVTIRECYLNQGTIYFIKGLNNRSLKYFLEAINYSKSLDKEKEYNNLGAVFFNEGEYEEALKYYGLALDIFKSKNDTYSTLTALLNIGDVFKIKGKYELALTYYNDVLNGNKSLNNLEFSIICLNNIGEIKLKTNETDSAISYFKQALSLAQLHSDQVLLSRSHLLLGTAYFNEKMITAAQPYLKKSFEIAHQLNLYSEMSGAAKILEQIYAHNNNFKEAFYYLKMDKMASDSIRNNEAKSEIMRLMFDHKILLMELNEKERIEIEKNEQKKNTLKLYTITFLLIIISLILFIVIYRYKQKNRYGKIEKEKSELMVENMERELELRNFEIVGKVLSINEKNELIDLTAKLLNAFSQNLSQSKRIELASIIKQIKERGEKKQWEEFYFYFTKVYSKFFEKLEKDFPELTVSEKRLCAFLKLNMTTKDIASLVHLNIRSVEVARTRLRKKLNLTNSNTSFTEFFNKYN